MQTAARAIKSEVPEMLIVGDVCLCEYTSHGHCGVVRVEHSRKSLGAAVAIVPSSTTEYEILNDATLELLGKTAVSQARAGVDIIAPSDMMDGRVGAIRKALTAGQEILPSFLMPPSLSRATTGRSARRLIQHRSSGTAGHIRWTAQSFAKPCARLSKTCRKGPTIMVKPALPYLDVIAAARDRFDLPLAAYQGRASTQ